MHICYIDEAGCPGHLPLANTQIQPALAIAGLVIPREALDSISKQFIKLKQIYFYGEARPDARENDILIELKGADLRQKIRYGTPNDSVKTHKLLDDLLAMLIAHGAQLYGRVLVKTPGHHFNGTEVYAEAMMAIAKQFHLQLEQEQSNGLIVADFRGTEINGKVSQPISAAMWANKGRHFPRFELPPTFGNSNSHVGLQIADVLISALLIPLALGAYEDFVPVGVHRKAEDSNSFRRYKKRLSILSNQGKGVTIIQSENAGSEKMLFK